MNNQEREVEQYFVDVWHGNLALTAETAPSMLAVLDGAELRKAEAFRLPVMRDRFIAVRVLLRRLLADYLDAEPAELRFVHGPYGKPGLLGHSLHFNLSHSADALLIAVGNFADIGVDIETVKPRTGIAGLAERCFSEQEFYCWSRLPASQQLETFYRLWTKKEAFVKAVGRGIAVGVERCEVEAAPGGQMLAIPAEYGLAADWRVRELAVEEGACAALITSNRQFELRQMRLE